MNKNNKKIEMGVGLLHLAKDLAKPILDPFKVVMEKRRSKGDAK